MDQVFDSSDHTQKDDLSVTITFSQSRFKVSIAHTSYLFVYSSENSGLGWTMVLKKTLTLRSVYLCTVQKRNDNRFKRSIEIEQRKEYGVHFLLEQTYNDYVKFDLYKVLSRWRLVLPLLSWTSFTIHSFCGTCITS